MCNASFLWFSWSENLIILVSKWFDVIWMNEWVVRLLGLKLHPTIWKVYSSMQSFNTSISVNSWWYTINYTAIYTQVTHYLCHWLLTLALQLHWRAPGALAGPLPPVLSNLRYSARSFDFLLVIRLFLFYAPWWTFITLMRINIIRTHLFDNYSNLTCRRWTGDDLELYRKVHWSFCSWLVVGFLMLMTIQGFKLINKFEFNSSLNTNNGWRPHRQVCRSPSLTNSVSWWNYRPWWSVDFLHWCRQY